MSMRTISEQEKRIREISNKIADLQRTVDGLFLDDFEFIGEVQNQALEVAAKHIYARLIVSGLDKEFCEAIRNRILYVDETFSDLCNLGPKNKFPKIPNVEYFVKDEFEFFMDNPSTEFLVPKIKPNSKTNRILETREEDGKE